MNSIFGQPQQPIPAQQGPSPFATFASNFAQRFPGMNPQQIAMQLLNSGQMSRADFEAFSKVADRITGRK